MINESSFVESFKIAMMKGLSKCKDMKDIAHFFNLFADKMNELIKKMQEAEND